MTDESNVAAKSGFMRFLPLILIGVAAIAALRLGVTDYLSLDALRENYQALTAFVEARFWVALILYMAAYITVAALSLPGAGILSITGGFLFGTFIGLGAVVVAATIGGTLIFLAARTAFGDFLRKKAQGFIKQMEQGFNNNAFSYLLLLRLIPIFPFFVVNIAPAFFGVSTRVFFLATLIGIIPGAFAFVSVGTGLGAILEAGGDISLSGLLTKPEILTPIIALSVLALIPIIAKALGVKTPSSATEQGDNS
ncbi:MAG: TVP38/TMEM64 family protein [Parvularculaceae bacterium]|nr:MAG: TVP38/TMEM64 family protein [Parvularculaceae bacterium]